MKNLFNRIFAVVLVCALASIVGCFGHQPPTHTTPFSTPQFDPAKYDAKVDVFAVLFDGSSSMSSEYQGTAKFDIARNAVLALNRSIPELGYTACLRNFGPDDGSNRETILVYGPEVYSTGKFGEKAEGLTGPAGNTPIGKAVEASLKDLESVMGNKRTAVIIFSDGKDPIRDPMNAVRNFKVANPNACFYTVLIGDDKGGRALMEGIAEVGQCGFATTADNLYGNAGMAEFVKAVFLTEKHVSAPPPPPRTGPCPDSDNDGVCDDADRCPGTPAGATVDRFGCWALVGEVLFDFDKSVLKPIAYPLLDEVADILKRNPGLRVVFEGHTDSVGTVEYNQNLSERRAGAVMEYMLKSGIPSGQMETVGYGESLPRATNSTEEGRSSNRRVEITPIK